MAISVGDLVVLMTNDYFNGLGGRVISVLEPLPPSGYKCTDRRIRVSLPDTRAFWFCDFEVHRYVSPHYFQD